MNKDIQQQQDIDREDDRGIYPPALERQHCDKEFSDFGESAVFRGLHSKMTEKPSIVLTF